MSKDRKRFAADAMREVQQRTGISRKCAEALLRKAGPRLAEQSADWALTVWQIVKKENAKLFERFSKQPVENHLKNDLSATPARVAETHTNAFFYQLIEDRLSRLADKLAACSTERTKNIFLKAFSLSDKVSAKIPRADSISESIKIIRGAEIILKGMSKIKD